jgi:hypothetical protein
MHPLFRKFRKSAFAQAVAQCHESAPRAKLQMHKIEAIFVYKLGLFFVFERRTGGEQFAMECEEPGKEIACAHASCPLTGFAQLNCLDDVAPFCFDNLVRYVTVS